MSPSRASDPPRDPNLPGSVRTHDESVDRHVSTLPPAPREPLDVARGDASVGTSGREGREGREPLVREDDVGSDGNADDAAPATRRAPSILPPPSSAGRDPFLDALCATAYLLGMRTEEIAEAIVRPLPAWMNAMARAPSAEARSRLLAPTLMDIEESLGRMRPR